VARVIAARPGPVHTRAAEAPRSRLPTILWAATAVFIVYGTTIPFNFVPDRATALAHWMRVTWNPLVSPDTGSRVSIPDFVSNILLFTPFGCFGVWALGRRRSPVARALVLTVLSVALSASVETLQLFTMDRTTSVADVFANGLGGLAGAMAGVLFGTTAEGFISAAAAAGLTDAAAFYPLMIATLIVCAGALEPFDATLDVGSVFSKVKSVLHDPLQMGPLTDEGLSFLQHLLFTGALVVWLKEIRVRQAAKIAALVGVIASVALEGSQFFIGARMPGLWDAGVGAAGALAGVAAGAAFPKVRRPFFWCAGVFALTAIGVAMQQLSPFVVTPIERPFQWIPFLNYYTFTTSETVSHSAELLLSYFPLGMAVALAVRARGLRLTAVVLAALVIAVPVEYGQEFIGGRYPDITDIALSVAGAWFGLWTATEGWRQFRAQLSLISPR